MMMIFDWHFDQFGFKNSKLKKVASHLFQFP